MRFSKGLGPRGFALLAAMIGACPGVALANGRGRFDALSVDLYVASAAGIRALAALPEEADVLEPGIDSVPLFHTAIIGQS